MPRPVVPFSGLDASPRMPWSAGCIINMLESEFSAQTGPATSRNGGGTLRRHACRMVSAAAASRTSCAVACIRTASLPPAVSVSGKRNFRAREKSGPTASALQTQGLQSRVVANTPANSGLFASLQEISAKVRLRGAGRSPDRTSLQTQIPSNWENNWEFFRKWGSLQNFAPFPAANSMAYGEIPDAMEMGILHIYLGICRQGAAKTGNAGMPPNTAKCRHAVCPCRSPCLPSLVSSILS